MENLYTVSLLQNYGDKQIYVWGFRTLE